MLELHSEVQERQLFVKNVSRTSNVLCCHTAYLTTKYIKISLNQRYFIRFSLSYIKCNVTYFDLICCISANLMCLVLNV